MNRSRIYKCVSIISLSTLTIFSAWASATAKVEPSTTSAQASAFAAPSTSTIAHGSGAPASPATVASSVSGGQSGGSASIRWTAPARWESKPASQMRAATYLIPAATGDSEGAECAVFANIGGGVQANIDRWIGQFEKTDGDPIQKKETINGMAVTTIDLSGAYKGGPPGVRQPNPAKPGYRLLGAIVEGPDGEVFFKLVGPAKSVASAQEEFQAMLKSLKK